MASYRRTSSIADNDLADSIARRQDANEQNVDGLGKLRVQPSSLRSIGLMMPIDEDATQRDPELKEALERKRKMRTHFAGTLQAFGLDHTTGSKSALSWTFFWTFIVAIPILSFFKVTVADGEPNGHQMPFARLVLLLETGEAAIAFVSFWHMLMLHEDPNDEQEEEDEGDPSDSSTQGDKNMEKGIFYKIFLKPIMKQPLSVQLDYWKSFEDDRWSLLMYSSAFFALHLAFKTAIYTTIPLDVPNLSGIHGVDLSIAFVLTSLAWIYRTTTFFFVCIVFRKICEAQELIMENYMVSILPSKIPGVCFDLYFDIIEGLRTISHRFRKFLAFSGLLSLFGILASMYTMVSFRDLNLINSSDLIVANLVGLAGFSLCLVSASKIAHLHHRIVKVASTVHAERTYSIQKLDAPTTSGKSLSKLEEETGNVKKDQQREWRERATLVSYLSATTAGISVYGFVLNRSFVHTSFGALLTTTWFILGRSLGALGAPASHIVPNTPPAPNPSSMPGLL